MFVDTYYDNNLYLGNANKLAKVCSNLFPKYRTLRRRHCRLYDTH